MGAACVFARESEDGRAGTWRVEAQRSDGSRSGAMAVLVEDSSAGSSTLVYGGEHGLRLTWTEGEGVEVAEPYLLLAPSAVLE